MQAIAVSEPSVCVSVQIFLTHTQVETLSTLSDVFSLVANSTFVHDPHASSVQIFIVPREEILFAVRTHKKGKSMKM